MWVKYKGAVEWCEQKLVHWQVRECKGEGGDRERRSDGSFNQPPGALSDAISQTPSISAAVLFHPPACAALPPPSSRSKARIEGGDAGGGTRRASPDFSAETKGDSGDGTRRASPDFSAETKGDSGESTRRASPDFSAETKGA
uniref:Uncharacterized protein n=1 Tax=Chromera velia CCMP2878 TaxID=1169474 RepID=A0A0G4IES8_9ALVE|eukprot:Cvel_13735.t1-p1 / transcript=Cvel_13735.t1 / gene=Cvel_13735 / organism=Chromera_velia_CCMP2878 / gene_product=hypothetical protein / transcript_product=hypothetical protein / location=Cvel_scaffold950:22379-22804(+) / protein_length=142 / sequence_SO=supercontig / SO=protein_coding / is_pseudo=false